MATRDRQQQYVPWWIQAVSMALAYRSSDALESPRDRDQSLIHGIGTEAEFLESDDAQERLRSRMTENDDRRCEASADAGAHQPDAVIHLPTIGQDERPFLFRFEPQTLENI